MKSTMLQPMLPRRVKSQVGLWKKKNLSPRRIVPMLVVALIVCVAIPMGVFLMFEANYSSLLVTEPAQLEEGETGLLMAFSFGAGEASSLQAAIDVAAQLYKQETFSQILIAGGASDETEKLIAAGFDPSSIVWEPSLDNNYSACFYLQEELSQGTAVIFAHRYHTQVGYTCSAIGLNPQVYIDPSFTGESDFIQKLTATVQALWEVIIASST